MGLERIAPGRAAQPQPERGDTTVFTPPGPASPVPMGPLMTVGHAHDPAEAQADAIADRALRRLATVGGPPTEPDAHQHGAGCDHVQRAHTADPAARVGLEGGALDSHLTNAISAKRGTGRALDPGVRGQMESAFDRSLGGVRIHDDPTAASISRSISARAFTTGNDIFFGAGEYRPETASGQQVLAHEIAHTTQDLGGIGRLEIFGVHLFGAKKTPEEQAAKAAEQKEAADTKEDLKSQQKMQKAEVKGRAQDRKVGIKGREEIKTSIIADSANTDGKTSATANNLNQEFARLLELEKEVFTSFYNLGKEEPTGPKADEILKSNARYREECVIKAYEFAWVKNASPKMQSAAPPRATAAERLTAEVRAAVLEDDTHTTAEKNRKHGTLLSKSVETAYDKIAELIPELLAGNPKLTQSEAEDEACRTVFGKEPEEVNAKRPTPDTPVHFAALKAAQDRTRVKVAEKQKSAGGLDSGIATMGTVKSAASPIATGVTAVVTGGLNQVAKPKDKALAAAAGTPTAAATTEEKVPLVGAFAKSINSAKKRVAGGQREDSAPKPVSVQTQASQGFTASVGIITSIIGAVKGIMEMAKAISVANQEPSAKNILKATKATAEGAIQVANAGKSAASLASAIDPGVTTAVLSVIPGFDIAISALGIVTNGISLGQNAVKVHETSNAMFDARTRNRGMKQADVLVFPLEQISCAYAKRLEQAIWNTAMNVTQFGASIAQVASAGGFGIPAAVKAGAKLVDLLHTAGHFVADQVIATMVQTSRTDSMLALEGAAENQLMSDPKMAVNGIIMQARKGDAIAIKFLQAHGITEEVIKTGKISEINATVQAEIGQSANPQNAYQQFKSAVGGISGAVKGVGDKWSSVGQLAQDKNTLAPGSPGDAERGIGWRIKMMFQNEEKIGRSQKKVAINLADKTGNPIHPAPTKADNSTMGMDTDAFEQNVLCFCGPAHLLRGASPQMLQVFSSQVESMSEAQIRTAAVDPRNPTHWQDLMLKILADKATKKSKVSA